MQWRVDSDAAPVPGIVSTWNWRRKEQEEYQYIRGR